MATCIAPHEIPGFDPNKDGEYSQEAADAKKVFSSCHFKDLPKLVNKCRGLRIGLKSPNGYKLRITGLEGTVYWGREEMLETWGKLYLPKPEEMVVMGAIDAVPSLAEGMQLIVLVDSLCRVYFYESEVLHLVAESVGAFLLGTGAASPPIRSFKYGEYCAPKTEEEYLQIMKNAGIPFIKKATKDFVQSKEKGINDSLDLLASL
ncbi:hypothetical protein SKAU_G00430570 [Synaphobranchus kaupii]|uniref:Uncharacterized protein n=1 Tax=Synaphobranchus kaupii TaxID=118154 RepID=A0A9Q1I961_SYNKA|nr:hypothetical protein SKAU_G00430570 [Synaphobranchus kaupii]